MTEDYISNLMEQFNKKEILQMSEELGLDNSPSDSMSSVMEAIINDLEENGVPLAEDCSDLLNDFLYVAMFVDEDGNLIEIEDIEDEEDEEQEEEEKIPKRFDTEKEDEPDKEPVEDNLPECFSFHDERDPACRKCKVRELCREERVKMRPACFGKLFQKNNADCEVCLERTFCKEAMESA